MQLPTNTRFNIGPHKTGLSVTSWYSQKRIDVTTTISTNSIIPEKFINSIKMARTSPKALYGEFVFFEDALSRKLPSLSLRSLYTICTN